LPAGVLVLAGDGIGKDGECDGAEAREAGKRFLFFGGCRPLFLLDGLQRAYRGEDIACLGLLAAGNG